MPSEIYSSEKRQRSWITNIRQDRCARAGINAKHGKFLDAQAAARRCFDQAAIAQNNRDFDKRDKLAAEGEQKWMEAKAIINDFRNV